MSMVTVTQTKTPMNGHTESPADGQTKTQANQKNAGVDGHAGSGQRPRPKRMEDPSEWPGWEDIKARADKQFGRHSAFENGRMDGQPAPVNGTGKKTANTPATSRPADATETDATDRSDRGRASDASARAKHGMPDAPGGIASTDPLGPGGFDLIEPMAELRNEKVGFVYKGIALEARTSPRGEYSEYLFIDSIFAEHPLKGTRFDDRDYVFVTAADKMRVSDSRNWKESARDG
ncbi:MAG: hypothetical protein V1728_03970 [Candidatus Micrarchaeota archaeon]